MNRTFGYIWLILGCSSLVISILAWSLGADHSNWFHETGDHIIEILLGGTFMRLSKYEKN